MADDEPGIVIEQRNRVLHEILELPPRSLDHVAHAVRSEEHTSELQSLMRISYAVFCLKKKKRRQQQPNNKTRKKKRSNTTINHDIIHDTINTQQIHRLKN